MAFFAPPMMPVAAMGMPGMPFVDPMMQMQMMGGMQMDPMAQQMMMDPAMQMQQQMQMQPQMQMQQGCGGCGCGGCGCAPQGCGCGGCGGCGCGGCGCGGCGFDQQMGFQQQQQPPPQQASMGPLGKVVVSGGQNPTVSSIVQGEFHQCGENCGRPVYKKTEQVSGLDVLLYFWDERDGPSFCGWWFGPKVGGDQVWAYSPDKSMMPPANSWKVPYDGAFDPSFFVQDFSQGQGQNFGQQGCFQQGFDQGYGGQQGFGGQQGGFDYRQQQQQQEEMQRRQRQMQEEQRQKEENAAWTIRKVIQKLKGAVPENFDMIRQELVSTVSQTGGMCGSLQMTIQQEADQAIGQAQERIAQIIKNKEEEEKKKQDQLALLTEWVKELGELVTTAEAAVKKLQESAAPILAGGDAPRAKIEELADALEEVKGAAKAGCKACVDFLVSKRTTIDEGRYLQNEARVQLVPFQQKIHESMKLFVETSSAVEGLRDKVIRKDKAATEFKRRDDVFAKHDKDKDGFLNAKEIAAFANSEFGYKLDDAAIKRLLNQYGIAGGKGGPGLKKEHFSAIKRAAGIAKEEAASRERVKEAEEKRKQLEAEKAELEAKLEAEKKRKLEEEAELEAEKKRKLEEEKAEPEAPKET